MQQSILINNNKKIFFLVFAILFIVFVFSSDGHRATFDEDTAAQQAKRIVLQEPRIDYIQDISKVNFEYERFKNPTNAPVCLNGVLCTTAKIVHSVTEVPFIFINNQFSIITDENLIWTTNDFPNASAHYVWWRNSIDPNLTFMELFYGPFYTALSGALFFLIARTFHFNQKISLTLTMLYAFSTPLWAYSQTSLNSIPMTFFMLLSYYYFRKFQLFGKSRMLIISSTSLGLGFLSRLDIGLIIIVLFIFSFYLILKSNAKIKHSFSFLLPLIIAYIIDKFITHIRFGVREPIQNSVNNATDIFALIPYLGSYPIYEGGFGLLFSPGVGLFVFAPILLTAFFSFPDFFKKNKQNCIAIIVIVSLFIIYYGTLSTWHGLVSWGPRYLIPMIPFLLIPLGASLEKRNYKSFLFILIPLAIIGALINLSSLVQDVSWFIWGWPGQSGLFGIDIIVDGLRHGLNLDPVVLWTFEYSQLTQSVISFLTSSYSNDIFLFKIFGTFGYFIALFGILIPLTFMLVRILRFSKVPQC